MAKVLASYTELKDRNRQFEIVDSLFNSRSYEGLRAGIQRAIGKIPEDVENVLKPFEQEEDEGVYSEMIRLLPDLISSFRREER
ncbi:MAG: hypothetical protein QW231_03895 [Candidatus Bathyarchaeia archaeon]